MTNYPTNLRPQQKACYDAGCHDFAEPILIKARVGMFKTVERIASICRRCGSTTSYGFEWVEE